MCLRENEHGFGICFGPYLPGLMIYMIQMIDGKVWVFEFSSILWARTVFPVWDAPVIIQIIYVSISSS